MNHAIDLAVGCHYFLPGLRLRVTSVALPDGATCKRQHTSDSSLLLIYRPRKDESLSWPSWLTCSGRFTHINVTHQLQVERRTGKVRQSETGVLPLCHATNLRYDTRCFLTCAQKMTYVSEIYRMEPTTKKWKEEVEQQQQQYPFNGPLSGTTQVSRYQKGKTNLDFTEARDRRTKT